MICLKALWSMCIPELMLQRVPQMKRIIAQRHNLCVMGINSFGHVMFGGYAFVEYLGIQGHFHAWNQKL